ncbi:MAG: hypothetical protein KF864_12065 [Phycisphaeraceae bacterium]|nr:hypothetical protein [Phycisphaeraceae bacterium]
MKSLVTAVGVIAAANLIALVSLIFWLHSTDRLDMDRVRHIRQVLAQTITDERAAAEAAAAEQAAAALAQEQALNDSRPPLTAIEQLTARIQATSLDRERVERLRHDVELLQKRLADDSRRVAQDRAALEQERHAFEQRVTTMTASLADEQFRKAVDILATLKPAGAKEILAHMLRGTLPSQGDQRFDTITRAGGSSDPGEQVVRYLNAMEERARVRILAEFVKDDPAMAADLLERLRLSGRIGPVAATGP